MSSERPTCIPPPSVPLKVSASASASSQINLALLICSQRFGGTFTTHPLISFNSDVVSNVVHMMRRFILSVQELKKRSRYQYDH